jgi:hypothetical protein
MVNGITFKKDEEQILYMADQIYKATSVFDVTWVDYWGAERTAPPRQIADHVVNKAILDYS